MEKILIVEDDPNISDILYLTLTNAGYSCSCVFDGAAAAEIIEQESFDLALLDIMLPELDGFALMEFITPVKIPVIFLTAKSSVEDRVKGLSLGADDYILKPFEPAELVARVQSLLRRCGKGVVQHHVFDVVIDTNSRKVTQNGALVELTKQEYDLLLALVQNRGVAMYRDALYEQVWGDLWEDGNRTLDLHIMRLRQKLGWQDKISTVFKIGYMLEREP